MFRLPKAKLVVPALAAFALSCDAQQLTSALAPGAASAAVSSGSRGTDAANTTIVLVHRAWADGTGWRDIIPLPQKEGYKAIAVQNPLASLAKDVETTRRVIDRETEMGRSVVAVAHSYGGAVMSGAAAGNPGVKALVYIAGQSNPAAAWRTIPSWFIVAQEDRVINPDLERFHAKRMNARTTEIDASHVMFISHPNKVAKVILEAAGAAGQ